MSAGAFVDGARSGLPIEDADFVIVGTGAGGGAAARVLAASGARVVVLEEGPRLRAEELGVSKARRATALSQPGQASGVRSRDDADPAGALRRRHDIRQLGDHLAPAAREILERWHREFGLADGMPQAACSTPPRRASKRRCRRARRRRRHRGRLRDALCATPRRRPASKGASSIVTKRAAGLWALPARLPARGQAIDRGDSLRRAIADGGDVVADAHVDAHRASRRRAPSPCAATSSGDGTSAGKRFRIAARRAVIVAGGCIQSP